MTIGERIKQKREELGMTQEELARLTGYKDKSSVAKIEKSDRDFPQKRLVPFAKALGVTVAELQGEAPETVKKPTFSYLIEQQMQMLGYSTLYDSEGNVILNHDNIMIEIEDADVKELELRMAHYLNFILSELEKKRRKDE